MKQETKDLLLWVSEVLNSYSFGKKDLVKQKCKKALNFLNSLPEIESKLCQGGYIQDRRGIPCCNGDKVRFEFEDKTYKENFIDKKYMPVEIGTLRYSTETKSFCIVFGPYNNGYDWIDWTTSDYGPKWFEKVE